MPTHVGMIGLTHPHSAMHLRTLDASSHVEGVVLCDANADVLEQVGRTYPKAIATYQDLDTLLARSDVPVVFIAVPNAETPGIVARAARAGKHIICEKPCARSATELRPALEEIERYRVAFTACYIWRANPAITRMRELVRAGALGRLTSIELRMVTTQVWMRNPAHWLFRREVAGGGIVSWLGCHWLDLLRYLTGQEVDRVGAMAATLSGEDIDVEDVASVTMQLTGGALASLYAGYLLAFGRPGYEGAGYDQSIIVRGTEGALALSRDSDDHVVTLESTAAAWRTASRQEHRFIYPPSSAYGGAHGLQFIDDFLAAALAGTGQIRATATDALRVLEILDAIYRSVEEARIVDVERVDIHRHGD